MAEETLYCPACGSASIVPNPDGDTVTCSQCGAVYRVEERPCPECQTPNPPGARFCSACGRALDLVGFVMQSRLQSPQEQLEETRRRAALLKQGAEQASQERLSQWWADETNRRQALGEARARERKKERQMMTALLIVLGIVVVGALAYVVISALIAGPPVVTPTPLP